MEALILESFLFNYIVFQQGFTPTYSVKWDDFVKDPEKYIEKAYDIQSKIEQYKIVKDL